MLGSHRHAKGRDTCPLEKRKIGNCVAMPYLKKLETLKDGNHLHSASKGQWCSPRGHGPISIEAKSYEETNIQVAQQRRERALQRLAMHTSLPLNSSKVAYMKILTRNYLSRSSKIMALIESSYAVYVSDQ